MRNFRSKTSKWKLSLSAHMPASPYFSNCDDEHHKPNNFEMAAYDSSHKLHGLYIQVKAKNEVLVASWKEVATPYFIFPKMNFHLVIQNFVHKLRYCSHHQSSFSSRSSSSNQLASQLTRTYSPVPSMYIRTSLLCLAGQGTQLSTQLSYLNLKRMFFARLRGTQADTH